MHFSSALIMKETFLSERQRLICGFGFRQAMTVRPMEPVCP